MKIEWFGAQEEEAPLPFRYLCLWVPHGNNCISNDRWLGGLLKFELPDRSAREFNRELQPHVSTGERSGCNECESRDGKEKREEEEPALARDDLIHEQPPFRLGHPYQHRRGREKRSGSE